MPKINLESSDKKVFSVEVKVAKKSLTLQDTMTIFGIEEDGDENGDPIPLHDVDAANLERLLQWAEEHKDDPPAPTDDETKYRTDNISDFDKEFFNMDQAALLQLIHAANFMNIPDLLLTACKIVAIMMSSLSSIQDWQNLPDVIFGDIMMIVGLESLETLHACRQVCRSWNEMIVGSKIFQSIL